MMELSKSFTGTRLRTLKTVVSSRHATNYAAAINDMNPLYFDDEREGGCIAFPMFVVALTWPIIGNIAEYFEDASFPLEVLMTMVHHTERIDFHRPMVQDEELSIAGTVKEISQHRAGTRVVLAFHAADSSGLPVFSEEIGAMLRGVACVCDDQNPAQVYAAAKKDAHGQPRWTATVPVSHAAPYIYDGCTGIHFPIHTSPMFAKSVGLPGIIHQGTATLALAVKEIIDREADGDPRRLKSVSCRFSGMVFPGTNIRVSAYDSPDGVSFDVADESGHTAISDGRAEIAG